jgi:hypothetical protein
LIPESLVRFYRRMAKAWRSPAPPDAVAIARLSGIVELHHCVAAAIQAAIERSEPDGQEHLRHLHSEQTRLAHAVGELVAELGGSPPRPDESSSELPREPRAMSFARNQQELMGFVHEDLDYLASAHQEMASLPEIPLTMRQRLEVMLRGGGDS